MAIQILFTAIALVALLGCFLAVTRTERTQERCKDYADTIEIAKHAALEDRHRVTSLERDVAALRRELRKLSGKFYATLAQIEDEPDDSAEVDEFAGIQPLDAQCDNWTLAQRDGPTSDAAKCECVYCLSRRAERRALRAALVPKTVGAQADLAKLNAGKP